MNKRITRPRTLAERYPLALGAAVTEWLLVVGAGLIAHMLRFGQWMQQDSYFIAITVMAGVVIVCQFTMGSYESWRGLHFLQQLGRVYSAWLLALAVITTAAVLLHVSESYSRIWFVITVAIAILLFTAFRLVMYLMLRRARVLGKNLKRVVVVESGSAAASLREREHLLAGYGYHVARVIPLEATPAWLDRLEQIVEDAGAHELWICSSLEDTDAVKSVLHAVRLLTVDVRYVPDLPLLNHQLGEVAGLITLDINRSPLIGALHWVKRAEDLLLGGLLSIIVFPVCLLIAIVIKSTSPGPVLFKQYRTGINGRRFKVYKFRTMVVHRETDDQITQASRGDPRITRVGAFLRRTSLDELPQFYNVLQGRMSLVGPRPHALTHNQYYKGMVESYMQRHKVKPGITGWAQINGYRGETDTLEKMEKRVEHDVWYINNWSLGLDLEIIAMTIFKGFVNEQP